MQVHYSYKQPHNLGEIKHRHLMETSDFQDVLYCINKPITASLRTLQELIHQQKYQPIAEIYLFLVV